MNSMEKYKVDSHDYELNALKNPIKYSFGEVNVVIDKKNRRKCIQLKVQTNKVQNKFYRIIEILSQITHPTFIPFIGYSINKNKTNLYFDGIENGSLSEYIKKNTGNASSIFDDTQKLIISYGIACSMKYLHSRDIIFRDLKSDNILLDSDFHPHILNLCASVNVNSKIDLDSTIRHTTTYIMAPEFIEDYTKYNRTKPIDVFSYSMILYSLWTGIPPYDDDISPFNIAKSVLNNIRP